jgi:hypothetical protein
MSFVLVACASPNHEQASQTPNASVTVEQTYENSANSFEQRRAIDRLLLSDPAGFQYELGEATGPFNECVDEHIAIYISTTVSAEMAARTTVAECAPTNWEPIIDLLNRAQAARVEVDGRAIRDQILTEAHERIVSTLENHSI